MLDMRKRVAATALVSSWTLASCGPWADGRPAITDAGLAETIQVLASDEFEGRSPSSPGEDKTVEYLVQRFRELGLQPGVGDSYTQDVPLIELTVQGSPTMTIERGATRIGLTYATDYVAWTKRVVERASLEDSELVFVGYGIVAPEFDWNDYAGLDVEGKTVVVLVNDPGYTTEDDALFRGEAMTYYGRWTYKFEEAARQGARGALIVHQTEPAGYPWEVVSGGWTGPQFDLVTPDRNRSRIEVEGWITEEAAQSVFSEAGLDFDELATAAAEPGFQAVSLGVEASVTLENRGRRSTSRNVLAVIPGVERPDQYVIYTAHWDHLGVGSEELDDPIFNGAYDNATGVAGLIELAKAFNAQRPPPNRSVIFMAVTAEEQGLLGSRYYAENPVHPTNQTVAVVNIDGLNVDGPMRDITVVGYGNSELDGLLASIARAQRRSVRPDPEPEKGFYYRSDHFSFAKVGIPALYTDSGIEHVEHGSDWTLARRAEYTAERYHKPSDEYDPSWDLTGAVDDLRLLYVLGHELAWGNWWPNWNTGTEFRAIRDRDMARRGN
jgi:Zn-dependent M28 family amino/carboxypeptidase